MSPRSVRQRLEDLLTAIDTIRSNEQLCEDKDIDRGTRLRVDAVVRELAIIGEAASHLPDDLLAAQPTIPWADVRGIRIVLDHGYHRVDESLLWRTVDEDLGPLYEAVQMMLDDLV